MYAGVSKVRVYFLILNSFTSLDKDSNVHGGTPLLVNNEKVLK